MRKRLFHQKAALLSAVALILFTVLADAAIEDVRTDSGTVSGTLKSDVSTFLGIPFAAPPVGNLRWRPPQPPPYRNSSWKADQFGTSCMQNQTGARLPWTHQAAVALLATWPMAWICLIVLGEAIL